MSSRNISVLITGAAGYIGSHMVLIMLLDTNTNYNIIALDNLSRSSTKNIESLEKIARENGKNFKFIKEDINNVSSLIEILTTNLVEIIIHFAAPSFAGESVQNPLLYYRNIVGGTESILEAMKECKVKKMIYSSSSAVYGNPKSIPIKEDDELSPISPYGMAKLMSENIIIDYAYSQPDFSSVILRYFNVIGSDPELRVGYSFYNEELSRYGRLVNSILNSVINSTTFKVYGTNFNTKDGSAIRDYVHVMDVVSAHLHAVNILYNKPQISIYNIGIGKGYSVLEILNSCKNITNKPILVEYHSKRDSDPSITLCDSSKLQRIGWRPKWIDIDEIIKTEWNFKKFLKT